MFKTQLRQTALLPGCLAVLIAIIFLWQIHALRVSMQSLDHSDRVISKANHLLKLYIDAETGVRGFDINREDIFLEPYRKSTSQIREEMSALEAFVADNPSQVEAVKSIAEKGGRWLEFAEQAIENSKSGDNVLKGGLNHHGKAMMDQIRHEFSNFLTQEERLRAERFEISQRSSDIAMTIGLTLGAALGLIIFLWTRSLLRSLSSQYDTALDDSVRSKEWFQTTLTSIGDAVIVVDKNSNVEFLNPIAEVLTGWAHADAHGLPMQDVFRIINEKTRQPAFNPVERVLKEGVVVGLANHTVLIGKDGQEFPIEDSAAPVRKKDGAIFGVVLVFRDVTERHKTETILQEAVRSRDEFLSIASHELKTPLTTLKLQLQMHLRNMKLVADGMPTAEKMKSLVEICFDQTIRLDTLVDSLLDVTRIQQGKLQYQFEKSDLTVLIAKIVEQMKPQFDRAKCAVDIISHGPLVATFDKFRIEQVIVNLLNNSLKYGPGKPIKILTKTDGTYAFLTVTDQGIGINKEKHAIIFERFERAIDATNVSGLGLGLHIVSQIVAGHQGKVEVHSEISKGATFTVTLPLEPKRMVVAQTEKSIENKV